MRTAIYLTLLSAFMAGCMADVKCLVDPCTTQSCIDKCKAFPVPFIGIQCVSNYTKGCDCDCCVPKDTICSAEEGNAPCCNKKHICAFSNNCVTNPFTKCGTICLPAADSNLQCKKVNTQCDIRKQAPCCKGSICMKSGKRNVCKACGGFNESCSASKPCCRLLACVGKGGKKTCQPAGRGL